MGKGGVEGGGHGGNSVGSGRGTAPTLLPPYRGREAQEPTIL